MELRSIVPPTENERSPDLTEPIYKTVAPHSIMRNTTGGRRRRASQRRRRRHKLRPGVGSALSGDKLKRRVVEAAHRRRERPVKRPLENTKNAHLDSLYPDERPNGAACGNRTRDLFITSESLCRLS